MKYLKNYLFALTVAALTLAACDKTVVPEYVKADPTTNEQVFFPSSVGDKIKMADGETSFTIPIQRGTATLEAMDVDIAASGEGIEYFTIPGSVSFASQSKTASLTITVTDVAKLGKNNFYPITLSIADASLTTPYGRNSITFTAGIELPWVKFDSGIYYSFWNEVELERTMEYQQISENMRYCRIQNFWDDEDDPMDIFWYWDTKTDICFILPTVLKPYDGSNNCVMSDMASFYTKYKDWEGDVGKIGSDEWFAWAGPWMVRQGDYPYYDGNGTFHMADWFYIASAEDGVPTGRGWQFGGDGDWFKGASFGDYTLTVSYDGMYVNPDGEAVPIVGFTSTKESAKYFDTVKYAVTDQKTDAEETLAAIVAGTFEETQTIKLVDNVASVQLPVEPGLYRIVAVPFVAGDKNDKGESTEYKTKYAQVVDFYFPGINTTPKEVEGDVLALDIDQLFDPAVCEENGYYHYNSFGYVIMGEDIKSGLIGMWKTAVTDAYPIETLLANCKALTAAQIDAINEKGYYADGYINLDPETSYTMIVQLDNVYGASQVYTATYVTGVKPYSGELVIGDYVITGSEDDCVITVLCDSEEDNTFIVKNLGIENEAGWNAVYDPEANTLTLNGVEHGYESYGNQFGGPYGYFSADHTMVYGIFVYNDEESEGDDKLVFSVDADKKELTLINQDVAVEVYSYDPDEGEVIDYLGDYCYLEAGSPVSPYVPNGVAPAKKSLKKAHGEKVANPAQKKSLLFKDFVAEECNVTPSVSFSVKKSKAPSQEVIYSTPVYGHRTNFVLKDYEPAMNVTF